MSERITENTRSGVKSALWGWLVWYATPGSGFLFTVLNRDITQTLSPGNIEAFIIGTAAALGITGGVGAYYRDKRSPAPNVAPQTPISPPFAGAGATPSTTVVPEAEINQQAARTAQSETQQQRGAAVASQDPYDKPLSRKHIFNLDLLKAEILREEGKKLETYHDTKQILTLGIGHRVLPSDPEYNKPVGTPVSEERVMSLFSEDVADAIDDAERLVKDFGSMPLEAQYVLIQMVFQMGYDGVKKFKNTLRYFNAKQWNLAASEMLDSKWYKQDTPGRAMRMSLRIKALAEPDINFA